MGCWCSKATQSDGEEDATVHAQYPVQSYIALQVHASAAEAVLRSKRKKAGDWFVRATPTYMFAALCASADQRPRSHRAFEVLLP